MSQLGGAKVSHRRHELLDDLVDALSVRGDSRTAAEVQGELAQRENIPPSVPTRQNNRKLKWERKHTLWVGHRSRKHLQVKFSVHVRNEMQNEVLGSQGVSQEDVSEVWKQLGSDRGHLAERRGQN